MTVAVAELSAICSKESIPNGDPEQLTLRDLWWHIDGMESRLHSVINACLEQVDAHFDEAAAER